MKILASAKLILKKLLDVLCPCCCVLCGKKVASNDYANICDECASEIKWISKPFCIQCGKPFYGEICSEKICEICQDLKPAFNTGRACFEFSGLGRRLIHTLKYKKGDFLVDDISSLIKNFCPDIIDFSTGAILVPVPLHSMRKFTRDFNQSDVIARALAKISPNSYVSDMLIRTKNTKSQTTLSREERIKNVKNIFICAKNNVAKNTKIIVIDDVITTGNTINECCKILKKSGFTNINILTLAHG